MTLETALTGINAATTELNSISNNIANNATTGFKRSRAEFADVYALSAFGGTGKSVGQGVRVAAIRQEFEQGDMQFTNRNLDLAVEGLGMFQLNDNGNTHYSRSGNFGLDREGYVVSAEGSRLSGFGVNADNEIQPIISDLRVDYTDLRPNPTTSVELAMNLDIKAAVLPAFDVNDAGTFNFSTSTTVYDSLGSAQVSNIYFRKDTPNSWTAYTYVDGQPIYQGTGDEITFAPDGTLDTVNGVAGGTFQTRTYTPTSGGEDMQFTIDINDISQYDNSFGVNRIVQDGFAAGRLEDFDIDANGVLFGRYSNGQAQMMGQVTLTNFPNVQGLRQVGNTSWAETFASGEPATGVPGSASLGKLQAGALEGSNVDITKELVSLIGAQRSFQANAQVISTSDTLTQTVINIRR